MLPLDRSRIVQFAPKAEPAYVGALVGGAAELERAEVDTPLRIAHFMAQIAHETGGFTIVRENTRWSAAQMCALWPGRFKTKLDPRIVACRGDPVALANLAYSARADLGNMGGDDGWVYRGGGFLQLTGRAAYQQAGTAIGVDLEAEPELIEDPAVSLQVALWVWSTQGLNFFADRHYARAVGNAINRGNPYSKHSPIGEKNRDQWLARALLAFAPTTPIPGPDAPLALGAFGHKVEQLQLRLRDLGYGVGDVDKVFGPMLARTVAAFKHDNSSHPEPLESAAEVGPATWAALDRAKPVALSRERTEISAKELAAKGSSEVAAGLQAAAAGQAALYVGLAKGADETGLLDQAHALLAPIGALKGTLGTAIDAAQWGLKNLFWAAVILGGVWYWVKGRQIVAARLKAHQFGFNLWR